MRTFFLIPIATALILACSSESNRETPSSSSVAQSSSSFSSSSSIIAVAKDSIYDSRDGKSYKIVTIGTQTWMAENLNYEVEGSRCHNNNPENCKKYGRHYDWATAMALDSNCNKGGCSRLVLPINNGICPEGWHVSSHEDWNILVNFVGSDSIAGTKLKTASGWDITEGYIPGTDDYGFSALPGGSCSYKNGIFGCGPATIQGFWWTGTDYYDGGAGAYVYVMYTHHEHVASNYCGKWSDAYGPTLLSVRCVKGDEGISFKVIFDTNGGIPATIPYVLVNSGAKLSLMSKYPENPTRDGYTFGGWFYGEEQYNSSTEITKEVTLVAKWNKLDDHENGGVLVDSRDNQSYRTVVIGGKRWMAQNLNYETSESWCYDNASSNCSIYGRLYTIDAAINACPANWHLPTDEEWMALIQVAGGSALSGAVLKSKTNWNGTDDLGFAAMPGGYRDIRVGSFYDVGRVGYWWSTDETGPYTMRSNATETFPMRLAYGRDESMYSMRCVGD